MSGHTMGNRSRSARRTTSESRGARAMMAQPNPMPIASHLRMRRSASHVGWAMLIAPHARQQAQMSNLYGGPPPAGEAEWRGVN